MKSAKRTTGRAAGTAAMALAALLLVLAGCGNKVCIYQVPGSSLADGQRVLVLPFMDTRTFVDANDPHRDDLGAHAQSLFAEAMRAHPRGAGAAILTPDLPRQTRSLTNAEVAEIGRQHGADVVVAGQVFSFTDTRAASIPPRAGMFIRVVSAEDGALMFIGDDYQAAAIPGAGGGRDLQARNVANRLLNGLLTAPERTVAVAGATALASFVLPPEKIRVANRVGDGAKVREIEPQPEPQPFPGFDSTLPPVDWDAMKLPEVPPIVAAPDSFYELPATTPAAEMPTPLPPPVEIATEDETTTVETAAASAPVSEAQAEAPAPEATDALSEDLAAAPTPALPEADSEEAESPEEATARLVAENEEVLDASFAARMTGDQLAADLFENESDLLRTAAASVPAPSIEPEVVAVETVTDAVEPTSVFLDGDAPEFALAPDTVVVSDAVVYEDGPVVSTPLASEQPRTYRLTDVVELTDDPEAARLEADARVARNVAAADPDAIRVLVLPYHDRDNENNLIPNTGGGEVVTALYGTQLATDPGVQVLWDASGQATHDRLVDRIEAIRMGQMVGADYVVRGQVVEFRRAQSVPSFYSVVISTAVLAAQVFFAEFSGVDVATEVYRVSDGACIMSRRDRAQQKYVVQAEKTVRKLAAGMASGVSKAIRSTSPELMDPLIDSLSPLSLLSNPH